MINAATEAAHRAVHNLLQLEAYGVKTLVATIISVHSGSNDDLSKEELPYIQVGLDGIVGVAEAVGTISAGDDVAVELYDTPDWLVRSPD